MTIAAPTTLPRNLKERVESYPEIDYAETAFRGKMESENISPTCDTPLLCKPLPNGTNCHEYLAIDFSAMELNHHKKDCLHENSRGEKVYANKVEKITPVKQPAAYYFFNFGAPVSVVSHFAQFFTGFLSITMPFLALMTMVLVSIRDNTLWHQELIEGGTELLPYVALPIALYYLLKWINKNDLLTRFNKTPSVRLAFRRDTGMVQFRKKGQFIDVPFKEIMAMTRHHTDNSGIRRITLHLNHKHSKLNRNLDSGLQALGSAMHENERWWYHLRWEFIQHYMDITRPLPDIPELEPYRNLDPTTREWDKQHNRPKDYWLNMDQDTYKAMVDAACEKAETYPYDDAKLANDIDWTPAGDGKAWYQLG